VRELGQRVGLHVWCHALRHSSITAALDAAAKNGIGLDKVRAHSRHAAIGTLLIYADEHDAKALSGRWRNWWRPRSPLIPPLVISSFSFPRAAAVAPPGMRGRCRAVASTLAPA